MSLPEFLARSLRLPVIAAPMFIVSNPKLVIEQCKAGIVGSFPALNARPAEQLDLWLQEIRNELDAYQAVNPDAKVAPFAVNQICHGSNDRLEGDLKICVKHRVPLLITSLQAPHLAVEAAHSYGGMVFHDVINVRHARKALEAGVDGLILVCAGAGGHGGTLNPFALVSEIRRFYDGPVVLSGAVTRGEQILAAQVLGADAAYMGTRFIATAEANASGAYKQMVVDSAASDIVYSNLFTGVHGNYLRGSIANAGLDPDDLPSSDKSRMGYGSSGSSKHRAWRDIWGAGQGVGSIDGVATTAEVVATLEREYRAALRKASGQAIAIAAEYA